MTFPITIADTWYESLEQLVQDIEQRGRHGLVDHPGQEHAADHFDAAAPFEGAVGEAMAQACEELARTTRNTDVLGMVFELWRNWPRSAFYETLLERLEGDSLPTSKGRSGAKPKRDTLERLADSAVDRLPGLAERANDVFVAQGRMDLVLSRALDRDDPAGVLSALQTAASAGAVDLYQAGHAAIILCRAPELLVPGAEALANQKNAVKDDFLKEVREGASQWLAAEDFDALRVVLKRS